MGGVYEAEEETDSDGDAEIEFAGEGDTETDAEELCESHDGVAEAETDADSVAYEADADTVGVWLAVFVEKAVTDGDGFAEYVGMTSETRPTPLNSRPSLGAVTTVIVGAYTNPSPMSPPSETRPSESD